jgi:hypothetical protein
MSEWTGSPTQVPAARVVSTVIDEDPVASGLG